MARKNDFNLRYKDVVAMTGLDGGSLTRAVVLGELKRKQVDGNYLYSESSVKAWVKEHLKADAVVSNPPLSTVHESAFVTGSFFTDPKVLEGVKGNSLEWLNFTLNGVELRFQYSHSGHSTMLCAVVPGKDANPDRFITMTVRRDKKALGWRIDIIEVLPGQDRTITTINTSGDHSCAVKVGMGAFRGYCKACTMKTAQKLRAKAKRRAAREGGES